MYHVTEVEFSISPGWLRIYYMTARLLVDRCGSALIALVYTGDDRIFSHDVLYISCSTPYTPYSAYQQLDSPNSLRQIHVIVTVDESALPASLLLCSLLGRRSEKASDG
ncbi:hypothetical protein D8B26_007820 [Coccidioides posadasii str. Silveira]|uniref:uncharacterized protein n=1 Tax=Coccidioides posadasii (strain RMSCC 757 / Silveira) TaxID=443226 RepID=UPI001BF06EAA|nr:hypothetical protein D8B26_007820 [Coccidioides posadasii str. Silveira]